MIPVKSGGIANITPVTGRTLNPKIKKRAATTRREIPTVARVTCSTRQCPLCIIKTFPILLRSLSLCIRNLILLLQKSSDGLMLRTQLQFIIRPGGVITLVGHSICRWGVEDQVWARLEYLPGIDRRYICHCCTSGMNSNYCIRVFWACLFGLTERIFYL